MDITNFFPIVVFDNQCYLCIKFAKIVNYFGRGKFTMIGHYTPQGEEIRKKLDDSALEMFWLIDKKTAYGGRAGLIPLIKIIFSRRKKQTDNFQIDDFCNQECKTIKAVFVRSTSLLTNSKIIKI